METKEPDSRLSVRRKDLDDQELYRLNQIINDLYSKVSTARDETADASRRFIRSGVVSSASDSSDPSVIPVTPGGDLPQIPASDWVINPVVYSAGEDGQQYGFVSITVANKPPVIDYFSLFVQDYSSGYVNTVGTAVTLTSSSKEAGNTFENCIAGQIININSVAYTIAVTPTSPYESLTLTSSAGTQNNVYFNLDPVDGAWIEIASDAEAGSWQLRPPQGLDVPCCVTASTKLQKTYEPPNGTNYKRLVFAVWAPSPQISSFTVAVEEETQAGVKSGRFVVNFTPPLDPEYNYSSIERLWYVSGVLPFTGDIGATAFVNVAGATVTYNPTYDPTFIGQNFNHLQAGDTVYLNTGTTLSDSNTYIISEVISPDVLKLTTSPPSGTGLVFAQWARIAGESNSFRQTDYWPLPSSPGEFWKFRARSVNHNEVANNTSPPTVDVTVPFSTGVNEIAPGTITAAAFASTIRPVDLVTTAGISVTSIVVATNVGTVTTSSAHGLSTGRQVAIYGGTGTSSKVNGLYTITVTGGSTFTVTTAGVLNGTYSAGFFEVPFPVLPSAIYPNGAVAFMTANTKLYRSNNSTWTSAADGSDLVANSITAGQIAAGAISTTELFAGEILVGAGSGRPTRFQVVDSSSNMIGFIGDITTPIAFLGAYFVNLRIGPDITTPVISANSSGVSINGATFALTANGITTTVDNSISSGYTAGLRIFDSTSAKMIQIGLSSGLPSIRLNDTTSGSPSASLIVTPVGGTMSLTDQVGTAGVECIGQSYSTGAWRGSVTAGLLTAVRELTVYGTIIAGSSAGTSGQVLVSTGTGVQWSTGVSGTLTSINSMTGPPITIAAGSGISISNASNTVTITNTGVTSITGTASQVTVLPLSTGAVTLSLPQDIATSSNVIFGSVTSATVGPTTLTGLNLRTDNTTRWSISSVGMLIPAATDTYDIGILSSNRVRSVYAKVIDTAISGGTGDYLQTRKIQLFDNTGSTTAPAFWDINVVASGAGAGQNSNLYIRDSSGADVVKMERVASGVSVSRTVWYTDLLPDSLFGRSIGSTLLKWNLIYANQIGDSSNQVIINGGSSTFSQVETGSFLFTVSPSAGAFLKSDASGYSSWANITSQLSAGAGISISGTTTATIANTGVIPLISGGTAVSSTLTLQSTSGAGSSDAIIFNTASQSERMRISTGGNVGIGTTAPRTTLSVLKSGTANTTADTLGPAVFTGPTAGGYAAMLVVDSNDAMAADRGGSIGFYGRNTSASTASSYFASIHGLKENSTDAPISGFQAGYLAFKVRTAGNANPEVMRITSTENVGIGTTSPAYKLDVSGTINVTGIRLVTGALAGRVLTSDASGNGTWVAAVTSITGTANQVTASPSTGAVLLNLPQNIHSAATPTFGGMTINGALSVTGTVKLGTSSTVGYVWKATDTVGNGTWAAVPTSITGTPDQVVVLPASTGAITLSLPQSINTTSTVTFDTLTLSNGGAKGLSIKDTGSTSRVVLTIAGDNNLYLDNNTGSTDIYIRPGTSRNTFVSGGYFSPNADNATSLGYSGHGWLDVYSYAYHAHNGVSWQAGVTGTFITANVPAKTVTVQDGIIVGIV